MPLLTLTSDIGEQDFLAGAIKGQLLQSNNNLQVIDITHSLSPFNYPQAAYVCRNAIKNFAEYGKGNVIFLDGGSDGMEKTMKQIMAMQQLESKK